jgi:branched-chain amino acid transport system permease protein
MGGVLLGFIYVLISLGLTLIYGVMGITNFANGDFLSLAMYAALVFNVQMNLDPLVSLPLVVLLLAAFGALAYQLLIKHVLKASNMAQIFVTFGMMIFLRGIMQFAFTANYQMVENPLVSGTLNLFGASLSKPQVVAAAGALIATIIIYLFISKTKTGWALQAVSENRDAASLMGIHAQKMYMLAWIIGGACVGVAGSLMAEYSYIYPEVGAPFGTIAIIVVALGGFGSVPGAFISGLLIGLVEVVGGFYFEPAYKYLLVFGLYFVFVVLRPQGIMGKRRA